MCLSSIFFSILILTTTANIANAALTATTANTIQGTAPYIEFNGVKVTDLSRLLSIDIGGETYISNALGEMKKVNNDGSLTTIPSGTALTLSVSGAKFDSVTTLLPADATVYSFNNPSVKAKLTLKDDDGDGNFDMTGNLTGEWKDKYNNSIGNNLTESPTLCNAPYTLTLTTTNTPTLTTQYGDPDTTTYSESSAVFTINPVDAPRICNATPGDMTIATGQFAGPADMWNTSKGFLTQSTYSQNFPTTGADGLYFYLDVEGVDARTLTWPDVTVGTGNKTITAKVTSIKKKSVKVTITGPVASSAGIGATAPLPQLPAKIELIGQDGTNTPIVSYGFSIRKWFVNRKQHRVPVAKINDWCDALAPSGAYTLAKLSDFTNASRTVTVGGINYVAPTMLPVSLGNHYHRRIGGGFASEWGFLSNYVGAGIFNNFYWTSDLAGSARFLGHLANGQVILDTEYNTDIPSLVCTQP